MSDWLWDVRYLDEFPVQDQYIVQCKLLSADRAYDKAPDEERARDSRMALRRKLNGDTR